jgi:protein SCO1/2
MLANEPSIGRVASRRAAAALMTLAILLPGCKPGANSVSAPTSVSQQAGAEAACCERPPSEIAANANEPVAPVRMTIPDVALIDQNGRDVRFASDVVKGRVVAINFIFTACKAACPSIGLNFAKLQDFLVDRIGKDCVLVTVSVDPVNDRPEDMKAWPMRHQFEVRPGWSLLTGTKANVDRLLKALNSFSPDRQSHSQMIVVGDPTKGSWRRVGALSDPAKLAEIVHEYVAARDHDAKNGERKGRIDESAARTYFTDTVLINQNGERVRFYSDLLEGNTVVINAFFSECKASCLKMSATMKYLQDQLGERIGKDVQLISLSVDPDKDAPEKLAEYARGFGAKKGWTFLSGNRENVSTVLRKVGQYVERREDHTAILLVGKLPTGLWKKVNGLASAPEVLAVVEGVLSDEGEK